MADFPSRLLAARAAIYYYLHMELIDDESFRAVDAAMRTQYASGQITSNFRRDVLLKKYCCFFGFCPNEGGGACPNFLSHNQELHFWSIKEPISFKMQII